MEFRPFGPAGEQVAVIGQGTWRIGDPDDAAAAIEEGIRLGMTHIDTAELYEQQSGSETMLGPIVDDHRDDLFVASKVWPRNATRDGVPSACKDSLVRLHCDELDLYYLHWPGEVDLEESLNALADLQDHGWIRHIGVSNFDVQELEDAEAVLGKGRIAANQVLYHLNDRGAEAEVIPWCRDRGVAVVAYSPFGGGEMPAGPQAEPLERIATELGKTPHQVALAFLTREDHVFAIPKAERPEHVRENAGGAFELPDDAVARIDESFAVPARLGTA